MWIVKQFHFNGIHHSLINTSRYTVSYSPLYDKELIEFTLSIDPKLRRNSQIYIKWIFKNYPKVGNYILESTKRKLKDNPFILRYKEDDLPLSKIPSWLLSKTGLNKNSLATKNHMKPIEYWYNTNPDIRVF